MVCSPLSWLRDWDSLRFLCFFPDAAADDDGTGLRLSSDCSDTPESAVSYSSPSSASEATGLYVSETDSRPSQPEK